VWAVVGCLVGWGEHGAYLEGDVEGAVGYVQVADY